MHTPTTLTLLALSSLSTAHFALTYPEPRGSDSAKSVNFPCGGFPDVRTPRSPWPQTGGPIAISLDHTRTNVAVYLAVGEDPGSNFSIVLKSNFEVTGLGGFCLPAVTLPEGVEVADGTPATVQVVTNGHGGGGLYECADITITSAAPSEQELSENCRNNTGVSITNNDVPGAPNGTTDDSGSDGPSGTTGADQPANTGAAAVLGVAPWVLGAAGAVAAALL